MKDYFNYLGLYVKDVVSGVEGYVGSISFDLYGCVQAAVHPVVKKDGDLPSGHWFDIKRLKVLKPDPVMPRPTFETMKPGVEQGPSTKPTQNAMPVR